MTAVSVPGIAYPRDIIAHAAEHAALLRKIPYILAQSAVPVCLAPNGTVATNGIVTLGTALPTTYSGGIWLRLPAGAVVAGSAGLYWAVMTSTTQGQVYTAFADPASQFTPYIPTGLVAAVGSNAAYTQTTAADITLVNVTVPGGTMGVNGGLLMHGSYLFPNNGNNKLVAIKYSSVSVVSNTRTTTSTQNYHRTMINRGAVDRQCTNFGNEVSGTATTSLYSSVNSGLDQALTHTGQIVVATDYVIIEMFAHQILPS